MHPPREGLCAAVERTRVPSQVWSGLLEVSVVKSACRAMMTMSDHADEITAFRCTCFCTIAVFLKYVWTSWGANRRYTLALNNYETKIIEDHHTYEIFRSSNMTWFDHV